MEFQLVKAAFVLHTWWRTEAKLAIVFHLFLIILHLCRIISSSYAKILGEKLFRTWEIPRSGLKAEDGGEEREKERLNNGENNGQATHGARKHAWRTQAAWAKIFFLHISSSYAKILGEKLFRTWEIPRSG